MLLSAVSILVVAQSSSEIPEGLMNNPVYQYNEGLKTCCGKINQHAMNIYGKVELWFNNILNLRTEI